MSAFFRSVWLEFRKMGAGRGLVVFLSLLFLVQPLFSYIEGRQLLAIGLDATPQTHPQLAEPVGDPRYLGFDVLPVGELVILIYAAILGAADYRTREVRTTLLAVNRRSRVLGAKFLGLGSFLFLVGFASAYLTVAAQQLAAHSQSGVDPATLTSGVWQLIAWKAVHWTALGLMSYAIALLCRNWLPAAAVLAPLTVGIGNALVSRWSGSAFLPSVAGSCLSAIPDKSCHVSQNASFAALVAWLALFVAAGWAVFSRRDVGAR